jgi:hypothetical protein
MSIHEQTERSAAERLAAEEHKRDEPFEHLRI